MQLGCKKPWGQCLDLWLSKPRFKLFAPLNSPKFMCEITIDIYHKLQAQIKHREGTCIHLRIVPIVCEKYGSSALSVRGGLCPAE